MKELKLAAAVSSYIARVGDEEALRLFAEKTGKQYNEGTVKSWAAGRSDPPLSIAQIVIDMGILEWEAPKNPFEGASIYLLCPNYRDTSYFTDKAKAILRYKYKNLGELKIRGSEITLARNKLADRFLTETDAEWALWLDSDMAPPTGYPAESAKWGAKFDPSFNKYDVIERLMGHGKTLVSALYFDRHGMGIPMFAEGRNSERLQQTLQRGPQDRIMATDWVGAGCCLVHRKVYEDMLEKIPEIRKPNQQTPNGFYQSLGNGFGEDTSFSIRAKSIGHQPHVDLGCIAGHVGEIVHFNEKIR